MPFKPNRYLYGYLFVFLFLICSNQILGQTGIPYLKNYTSKEYDAAAQNWSIVQDHRGVIYIGNNFGILEYDGTNWNLIPVSNESLVRSLSIDKNGIIYVGAQDEFGFLLPDSTGSLKYHSLIHHLDSSYNSLGDIWQTHVLENDVYFQSSNYIFKWNGEEIKSWRSETSFHILFNVNNQLFVRQKGIGLMQLIDDGLQLIKQGERFADNAIYAMLQYNETAILIGTRDEGLLLLETDNEESQFTINKFPNQIEELLTQNIIYNGTQISTNEYAFGTINGGMIVMDKNGQFLYQVDKNSGLQDNTAWAICNDKEKGVWLALNNGISRIETSSPLSVYNNTNGLEGTVEAISGHGNKLYAATHLGVYFLEQGQGKTSYLNPTFQKIESINEQCWHLLPLHLKNYNSILVANNNGIYEIQNGTTQLILPCNPTYLYQSRSDTNRIFIGLLDGIASIKFQNNKWIKEGNLGELSDEIATITEDENRNLWLGTYTNGVYKLEIQDVYDPLTIQYTHYDSSYGVPDGWVFTYHALNRIVFATTYGLYKQVEVDNKVNFQPDQSLGLKFTDGSRGIHRLLENDSKKVWMFTTSDQRTEIGYAEKSDESLLNWIYTPFLRMPKQFIQSIYTDKNNFTWIGGTEGLVMYNPNKNYSYETAYSALIRHVSLDKDSVIFSGTFHTKGVVSVKQPNSFIPTLPFKLNSIQFEYCAPSFNNENANEFQYFLKGFDKNWSSWSKEHKKQYTNLPEAQYEFYIKARNVYNHISEEAKYEFTILPPWYRTLWAYISYLIVSAGIIYIILQLYLRKLRAENARLERIVDERTKEIRKQKDQIEKKNVDLGEAYKEIEEKNKDITDSINYAQKIQEAILPDHEFLTEVLPEYFILFKPRDIVSGDFYWSAFKNPYSNWDNEEIIIAACDCTGHGVPGAFMSMIGKSLLDKIVLENKVLEPDKILNNLHDGVRFALKQEREDSSSRDGMDLALCKLNLKDRKVDYAAANRTLFIIAKEDQLPLIDGNSPEINEERKVSGNGKVVVEVKSNKFSIGGYQKEDTRLFTNHEIKLQKGDSIYLFSDGYPDQFGGPKDKKYSTRRFKELLISIQELTMQDQKEKMDKEIMEWMDTSEQIDDILIIGIRV
ncbi:MAG: SpoIIE family protein phosphatase [Bacteroidia bacterium]|nr:SpoIIE family protein phosphatase [Bacteroidia bacterium]